MSDRTASRRTMDANGPAGVGDAPPGAGEPPRVGETLSFVSDPLAAFERCRDDVDADVVAVDVAGDRGYVLTHPEDVKRVLVTDATAFGKGDVARDSLGTGLPNSLVVTEGDQWSRDRTLVQPLFYRDRLADHAGDMSQIAGETVADWTPGQPVDVTGDMKRLTLRVLARTLLDVDLDDRLDDIERATGALRRRFDSRRLSSFLPVWVPTPSNVRAGLALADFYDLVGGLVSRRRAALARADGDDAPQSGAGRATEADRVTDDGATSAHGTDRDDLLSLLLTAEYPDGSRMDNRTVRDQLITFLVAGHETTALTLTYACYLLATNPGSQARLREELDEVTAGEGRPDEFDPGALESASVLDAVVSEALRLYPPAFVVFREPDEDVTIRGYEIPAGSVLAMPQWVVHRDPRWWDYPESFRPRRFLADGDGSAADGSSANRSSANQSSPDQSAADRPEYAFFPFGGGPRHCIGMRFARLEAKLALATILSRYRLEPGTEPPLSVRTQLTLQPDEPVTVVPREP